MKSRMTTRTFVFLGVLVALALVVFVGPLASSSPDGLEKVSADHSIDADAKASPVAGSPLADYSAKGVDDEGLSTGVAGAIGVLVTLGAVYGLFFVIKRRDPDGGVS